MQLVPCLYNCADSFLSNIKLIFFKYLGYKSLDFLSMQSVPTCEYIAEMAVEINGKDHSQPSL